MGAAAVACAAVALVLMGRAGERGEAFVPARLPVTPSTVPVRTVPASTGPDAPMTIPAPPTTTSPTTTSPTTTPPTTAPPTTPPTTTLPISPLNSLVGEATSAVPVPPLVDVVPTAVAIESIGLAGVPVRSVGVAPDGQLEVPDETEVGWYRLGAAPGQPGAIVLAAHVSWRGQPGPFLRLAEVEPGDIVDVALADGTPRRYQVTARDRYGKLMLPREQIWRTSGPETLVLITCGGEFNPELRRYRDNIVVTAVPVA